MYNDSEDRDYGVTAGHVMAGVVFGAAVGAALGLVLAPRTGKETRRMLAESGQRMRQQASDAYQQASTNVNDMMSRGRAAVSRGREAFLSARDRAADEVPRRVESAVNEIRSDFS
jgi:gas vesicle protein